MEFNLILSRCLNVFVVAFLMFDLVFMLVWPTIGMDARRDLDTSDRKVVDMIEKIWRVNITVWIVFFTALILIDVISYILTGSPLLSGGSQI